MNTPLTNDVSALNVLLIDDDTFTLEIINSMLQDLGVKNIAMAENGNQAVDIFKKMTSKPNLIICDIYMPDMDGVEVAIFMAQEHYVGGIIFLTGNDPLMLHATEKLSESKGLNLIDVIEKPIYKKTLSSVINKYISQQN